MKDNKTSRKTRGESSVFKKTDRSNGTETRQNRIQD